MAFSTFSSFNSIIRKNNVPTFVSNNALTHFYKFEDEDKQNQTTDDINGITTYQILNHATGQYDLNCGIGINNSKSGSKFGSKALYGSLVNNAFNKNGAGNMTDYTKTGYAYMPFSISLVSPITFTISFWFYPNVSYLNSVQSFVTIRQLNTNISDNTYNNTTAANWGEILDIRGSCISYNSNIDANTENIFQIDYYNPTLKIVSTGVLPSGFSPFSSRTTKGVTTGSTPTSYPSYDENFYKENKIYYISNVSAITYANSRQIRLNQWNHFAAVFTSTSSKFYLHGKPGISVSNIINPYNSGNIVSFLCQYNKGVRGSNCDMDHIRMYNRALSDSEINLLFTDDS